MTENLRGLFDLALAEFLRREVGALASDTSEQHLCGRLAMTLEQQARAIGFENYWADTEYNRKQGGRVKTIIDGDGRVIRIVCDLILHSRGVNGPDDNLIAIEMKKSTRPSSERERDRERLRAMTKPSDQVWPIDNFVQPEHVCGYRLGLFLLIDGTSRTILVEEFRNGEAAMLSKYPY